MSPDCRRKFFSVPTTFPGRPGPLLLIIMDGVGIGKHDESDGVFMARTPTLDKYFQSPLFTTLQAHGKAVGLPTDDDMGNSEVGHNALGAGRIFAQGAKLVNHSIATGEIYQTDLWKKMMTIWSYCRRYVCHNLYLTMAVNKD